MGTEYLSRIGKVIVLFLLLLIGFISTGQAQSLLNEDESGVSFGLILKELERGGKIKFYYTDDHILPEGKWSLQKEKAYEIEDLNNFLEPFQLKTVAYNEYVILIVKKEDWDQGLDPKFYENIANLESQSAQNEPTLQIGDPGSPNTKGVGEITFTVLDHETREPVIGCLISIFDPPIYLVTDVNGKANALLDVGVYELMTQNIGYTDQPHRITVYGNGSAELAIFENIITMDEVVVVANQDDDPTFAAQSGLDYLSSHRIQETPSFLGEPDVIKNLLFLPGVSSIGEGAPGFNVRGGNIDQNLVVFDEIPLFNTTHAFGLFGAINPDLVTGVNLYKGSIPAQFGGRASSALVLNMKTASKNKVKLRGGISPVSAKLSLETPIISETSSLIIGARSTYSDWILRKINVPDVQKSKVLFYDANFRYDHQIDANSSFLLSGYLSQDAFQYSDQFGFDYQMLGLSANWLERISKNLLSSTTVVYGSFDSALEELQDNLKSKWSNGVRYLKFKELFDYNTSKNQKLTFGVSATLYDTKPGEILPLDDISTVEAKTLDDEMAFEGAAFFQGVWTFYDNVIVSAGLRFSAYSLLGPGDVFTYEDNSVPTRLTIRDSRSFKAGESIISTYTLEPRLSLRWNFSPQKSITFGYSKTAQYVFQITNHSAPLPTDLWKLSDTYLPPVRSHNFSLSSNWSIDRNHWDLTLGGYYRNISGLTESREFADLVVSSHLETETVISDGKAFGLECSLKKNVGKLTGSLAYTWSQSKRKSSSNHPDLIISGGAWFPSNFDAPHNLSTTLVYKMNNRHKFAINFTYHTGRPITAPTGFFNTTDNTRIPIYSERNAVRIPDYHRLDITYTLGQGHRRNKKWRNYWTFGVYNLYGRRNAYSVFFTQNAFSNVQANRLSVLGSVFPAITYNFRFNDGEERFGL